MTHDNRLHVAGSPDEEGTQRCLRCRRILLDGRAPYEKDGPFDVGALVKVRGGRFQAVGDSPITNATPCSNG